MLRATNLTFSIYLPLNLQTEKTESNVIKGVFFELDLGSRSKVKAFIVCEASEPKLSRCTTNP